MVRKNLDYSSQSGINLENYSYKTHGFNIKYIEEECDLNEAINFDLMIDVPKQQSPQDVSKLRTPLNMEVCLFFADVNHTVRNEEGRLEFEYEKVSSRTYRVGNLMNGIYKYVPVEFTHTLASTLSTTVHCSLTSMRFCDFTIFDNPEL